MRSLARAAFLMLAWMVAGSSGASAEEGRMAMDEYIRTACLGNSRCEDAGKQAVMEGKGIVMTLAAMCQQIPRSKEEGVCFETGYGLAGMLRKEELQSTIEALGTTREQLVRFLASVHNDCGKRSNCYWTRLMGFEREYKVFQLANGQ